MISKTVLTLAATLVAVTSLVASADAQRASGPAMPFTQAEQTWFDIAEGPERLPK